jgi:uncharacterized protein YlxP (DUF503 family)
MIVGVCTIELYLSESGSLKSKRQVLRAIKDRVRGAFNVSVAEIDHHDLWQRATLGVAIVSTDSPFVHSVLNKVVDLINRQPRAEILDWTIEIR